MSKEHPTPWTIVQYGQRYTPEVKRGKRVMTKWIVQDLFALVDRRGVFVAQALDEATAKEICEAVNGREAIEAECKELAHKLEIERYRAEVLRGQLETPHACGSATAGAGNAESTHDGGTDRSTLENNHD